MKLQGKTAVITGGGRGIGRAIAIELAKEGANIVLAAPELEEIQKVASEIEALGVGALAVKTDVQFKDQVEALAKAAFDRFGTVEFVVNNGGVAIHNAIPDIKEDDWDFVMRVNLKGTFLVTQAFFSHMCSNKKGHIINIVSRAGKVGSAKFGGYVASKFGALGFTQVTDAEGQPFNVKATATLPGAVATQQRAENHIDGDLAALLQPEDVAEYVAFVATRPDRVYIAEASPVSQFTKPVKMPTNLKGNI